MGKEVIFEITKDHLETGMRNIPIGYCASSYIDSKKGLFYAGRHLKELALWEPSKVIYLLLYGVEPTEKQLLDFENELSERSQISQECLENIKKLPKDIDPLILFSISMSFLSLYDKKGDYREDFLNLIAKLPHLCSFIINYHAGEENKEFEAKNPYLKNFVNALNLKNINKELFYDVLKIHNILYYDHGGGSYETFVAKIIASSKVDVYSSVSAASYALLSDYNAKACIYSLKFIKKLYDKCIDGFSENLIEDEIKNYLKENKILFGFGHTVFEIEDPRASILFEFAKKRFAEHPLITTAFYLRVIGKKVLLETTKISNPNMNIDGISGAVLNASSFAYQEYYPLLIALARSCGIAIQLFHESKKEKRKLIQPHYIYRAIF